MRIATLKAWKQWHHSSQKQLRPNGEIWVAENEVGEEIELIVMNKLLKEEEKLHEGEKCSTWCSAFESGDQLTYYSSAHRDGTVYYAKKLHATRIGSN